MSKQLKNIIKVLLPCIFISYMVGISFFMHTHIINGVTIVHSHPFDKDLEHSHNTSEVELIHNLNSAIVTDSIITTYNQNIFFSFLSEVKSDIYNSFIPTNSVGYISLRAPPAA